MPSLPLCSLFPHFPHILSLTISPDSQIHRDLTVGRLQWKSLAIALLLAKINVWQAVVGVWTVQEQSEIYLLKRLRGQYELQIMRAAG